MSRAFISYADQDRATAQAVTSALQKQGIDIWLDEQEIRAGDSIIDRIREGILSVDYLIVLLSRHSNQSQWVQREIGAAFSKFGAEETNAILPVLIDSSPVPARFSHIRYVDLTKGLESGIGEIVTRIKRDCATKADFRRVVNTEGLAADLAADRKGRKGFEFYVTAALILLCYLSQEHDYIEFIDI